MRRVVAHDPDVALGNNDVLRGRRERARGVDADDIAGQTEHARADRLRGMQGGEDGDEVAACEAVRHELEGEGVFEDPFGVGGKGWEHGGAVDLARAADVF